MSALKLAVLRQVAYAHSVRGFIREILKVLIPGKWIDRVISDSDAAFDAKLDAAFATIDETVAKKEDYCRKVVDVLCDEVARLCEVLREVCEGCGYGDYARCYISHEKFVRLLLRTDTVKLGRLKKALAAHGSSPADLLRGIGAILDDRPLEEAPALDAAERRRANAEIKAIAADVKKTIRTGIKEVNANIKAGTAAVGEKVDAIAAKVKRGRRRGKYDDVGRRCLDIWEAAQTNAALRYSLTTRVTYAAFFARHRDDLEKSGIDTVEKFKKVIHAAQSKRSSDNIKKLESRQDKARQKSAVQTKPKYDIIPAMRTKARNAVALSLAIAGAVASPLRSDAFSRENLTPPPSLPRSVLHAA